MAMFKKIVVPVDFSKPSLQALDYAQDLAKAFKAEVLVVYAVEPINYPAVADTFGGPIYDTSAMMQELVQAGREQLSRLAARLEKRRLRVKTLLQLGTPYDVIVQAAKKQKADLIVISTHGRTGFAHVLMGSVAEKVVRYAGCPVLTVRGLAPAKARSTSRPARTPTRRAVRPIKKGRRAA